MGNRLTHYFKEEIETALVKRLGGPANLEVYLRIMSLSLASIILCIAVGSWVPFALNLVYSGVIAVKLISVARLPERVVRI